MPLRDDQVDKLPRDAQRVRRVLDYLELKQADLASLVGVDARTMRRYATGGSPVPATVALLLGILERRPSMRHELREIAREIKQDL